MDRGELAGEVGGGEIEVAGEANNRAQEDGFEGVDGVGEGGEVGVGHGGEENTKYEFRSTKQIRNGKRRDGGGGSRRWTPTDGGAGAARWGRLYKGEEEK